MDLRKTATLTGWLWIITFVTSIPARFVFYGPVLEDGKDYVLGDGTDAMTFIAIGAILELILIIANIGTAVVPYPIHKRINHAGALAFVTARVWECVFISIGIVCMLAISTLRQDAPSGLDGALGQGLEAVYEWAFRLGPGFVVGVGNGLILGWLMYKSQLVPRGLSIFGLIGGPLLLHRLVPRPVRRDRGWGVDPGPHVAPGGVLGVVARHLPRRQGVQAFSHHRRTGVTDRRDGVVLLTPSLGAPAAAGAPA